ncbi:hypothetical protein [Microbacterium pumilum]|uniref:Uncharacterized protein n=1 Tax=Microbacterium pumilum TaxID=344165 RepID=A0ABN2T385_9MICO
MPIKRRLTVEEIASRKSRFPGLRNPVSTLTEHTFLTDEENAALRDSLDHNETTQEFLARVTGDTTTAEDRDTLTAEFDRSRNMRIAAAQRRDSEANVRARAESQPVRQRQPVSPSNPFGAYLDERHDNLPEYPARGTAQLTQLQEAAQDYRSAVSVLEEALDSMTDDFAEAFAKEDARRAVRDRMTNTANERILREASQRRNRIG